MEVLFQGPQRVASFRESEDHMILRQWIVAKPIDAPIRRCLTVANIDPVMNVLYYMAFGKAPPTTYHTEYV